jgi:hypothetical protein
MLGLGRCGIDVLAPCVCAIYRSVHVVRRRGMFGADCPRPTDIAACYPLAVATPSGRPGAMSAR